MIPIITNDLKETSNFLCLLGCLLLLVGVIFSLLVLLPRTNDKPERGLIFWENVSVYVRDEYINDLKSMKVNSLLEKMIEQNYFLSKVASKKYSVLRKAFLFTSSGILILLLSGLFWLFK